MDIVAILFVCLYYPLIDAVITYSARRTVSVREERRDDDPFVTHLAVYGMTYVHFFGSLLCLGALVEVAKAALRGQESAMYAAVMCTAMSILAIFGFSLTRKLYRDAKKRDEALQKYLSSNAG